MKVLAKKPQPAPEKAAKPAAKSGAKAAAKAPAKSVKKPVAKAPAKTAVKVAVKAKVAKPVAKPAAKTVAKGKPMTKPASKSPAKSSAKPVAKPAAKPVTKSAAKPLPKPSPKPAAKKPPVKAAPAKTASAKSGAKPTPTANAKSHPAKPSVSPAKSASKPLPKTSATPTAKPAAKVTAPIVAQPVAKPPVAAPVSSSALMAPPPLKPGRRSSARVATQSPPPAPMVPTHAPDAAKASYSTMIERVIAPPPQAAAKKDPKLANNWKSKPAEQLTDDEVKAMPDSEYMNEKQLAFFRHKLSVLKQDIHNSAGETTEHLREDTVVVPDPADRATIEEEHALELRTRDRERKLLKKIEQSIARIDSGDYGYCDETGEPIGVGRLIARPTANLSLEAQQRRELKQKMFGD